LKNSFVCCVPILILRKRRWIGPLDVARGNTRQAAIYSEHWLIWVKMPIRPMMQRLPKTSKIPSINPKEPSSTAAGTGQLEVVRWMLENGARINYIVHGKPRCKPLQWAAAFGHLEVVKLLVQHGADIHANWGATNANTAAEDHGHFDIRDYLHSLGARTLRETTSSDYATAYTRFIAHLVENLGPLSEWRVDIHGEPIVTVHIIPANDKSKDQTLFTVGLSDHLLPQGRYEHACTELRCMLPPTGRLRRAPCSTHNGIGRWNG